MTPNPIMRFLRVCCAMTYFTPDPTSPQELRGQSPCPFRLYDITHFLGAAAGAVLLPRPLPPPLLVLRRGWREKQGVQVVVPDGCGAAVAGAG
ncbi:unnamed protein product [Closterium sp. NIES-54]